MFFNRKIALRELFDGVEDCHSHILPSVDDGVQTIEESLQVLDYFESLGVRKVTLTPHIMEEYALNSEEFLRGEYETFCSSYKGDIELRLAAEYMIDSGVRRHIESKDMLTLESGDVLMEMSFANAPIGVGEVFSQVMKSGHFVALAHPERYLYMHDDDYKELKRGGIKFQLNLLSLVGGYGRSVQRRAEWLLDHRMYDMLGSDIHSLGYYSQSLQSAKLTKDVAQKVEDIIKLK